MNAVEIKNLEKIIDSFILSINKLDVPSGYITGLIGKKGSGKTTIIKLMLNMLFPDKGDIKILGKYMKNNSLEIKSQIAFIGIESSYPSYMQIKKIKKMISRFYESWDDDLYALYINTFNIDEKKTYKELSLAKKKQFELCIALSHKPKLLIIDEPTVDLDSISRNEFLETLTLHFKKYQMSIFYASHLISDLDKSANFIHFINDGKIILSGSTTELLEKSSLEDLMLYYLKD